MQTKLIELIKEAEVKIKNLPNSYLSCYFTNVFMNKLKQIIKENK